MAILYAIDEIGRSERLTEVRCKSEDRELQQILEYNLDLLPGEQIAPEDPRRWLLIRREMPVPDPSTGEDRWSLDFLLADQDATPTFIECKRFADTRSRREIVGQMFEYAANGHYYWSKDDLRGYAERAASARGSTLENDLSAIQPGMEIDRFFQKFHDNLREGQIRIIFFLEQSPHELRSVVDFLNRQLERSEILIVEAKQFERNGQRFVLPSLFGYSEEARRAKRVVTVSAPGQARASREWDEATLFSELRSTQREETVAAAGRLLDCWKTREASGQCKIKWRGGPKWGGCSVVVPEISETVGFGLGNLGEFGIGFGNAADKANPSALAFRDRLIAELRSAGFEVREPEAKSSHQTWRPEIWAPKVEQLIEISNRLLVYGPQ